MNGATADCADRFTALYQSSYGAIYAYAARRVGEAMADEIAAETFLVRGVVSTQFPSSRFPGCMEWRGTWWHVTTPRAAGAE